MSKNKESKVTRTSYFSENRTCYVNKDGNYEYSFMELDENGKYVPAKVVIETNKENIEIIRLLDEMDHDEDKAEKRELDYVDHLVRTSNAYDKEEQDKQFADENGDALDLLIGDKEKLENKEYQRAKEQYKKFERKLKPMDKWLIDEHIHKGKSMGKIARENGLTVDSLDSRWARIRARISKICGISLPKRR